MLSRIGAIIATAGAAATLAVTPAATSSSATTAATWTVKPGGNFTTSGATQVKDTKTTTVVTCKPVNRAFTAESGSGLPGTDIASITAVTYSGCTLGTITIPDVTANGLPWKLNATSYDVKTGVTTGTITGIDIQATTTGCAATLDGTAAGADDGMVKFTYTNSTGAFELLPAGGNLHYWAVSGCLGLVESGDPAQASGSTTVKPKQTITSP
jgi:hypothetical protein